MARRTYTDQQRADALELYATLGLAEAVRRTGIAKGTISSWAERTGTQTVCISTMAAAVEAAALTMAQRKARLAGQLLDDIARLRLQLFAPAVERKPMVVSDGPVVGSHVEIVDVDLTQPSFTDQRAIMTSVAIAVDKVQILTGDVTSRTETVGPVERPVVEERVGTLLELASKRAS